MASYHHTEVIAGKEIPFQIYIERRKSVRVSFGRSSINLRIPSSLSQSAQKIHFEKAMKWVEKQVVKNQFALDQYVLEDYDNKKVLFIYDTEIKIDILYDDRKSGKGEYSTLSKTITLVLPRAISGQEKDKMIKQLLSRICAKIFLPKIEKRVHEINGQCFHKDIRSVHLKYNKSNWGSCSSATNINLSTRLLFAPMDVIDYVIIHELSHLYEMNHSDRFWNIVRQVMPSYKEKEKWLKENSFLCDF